MNPDAALVDALRRGDRSAFDEVYTRHHARIWAFLARLTRDRAEAEDLFQETWLAAARHVQRLLPDTELLPWLYTIARNKHRGARRFRLFDVRRRERAAGQPLALARTPDDEEVARRQGAALESALAALPAAQREVLILCLVEELETRQVAVILDVREDAVRKRLSRARAALAAALEGSEAALPARAQGGSS